MDIATVSIEIIKGIGLFFLHPLTYLFLFFTLFLGYKRVQRERRDFNTRVFDVVDDLLVAFFPSILVGLIVSILVVALGLVIPLGVIILFALIQLVIMLTGQIRFLSPAYTGSLTLIFALIIPKMETGNTFIDRVLVDLQLVQLSNIALLLGVLVLFEGILIFKNGYKHTSPKLTKSKRGKIIGSHQAQKLWVLPTLLVIPTGAIPTFAYWPIIPLEAASVSVMLVPFAIGYQQVIRSTLPMYAIINYGKRIIFIGLITLMLSILSIFYSLFVPIVAIVAILARELVAIAQKLREDQEINMYTQQENGLVVLGVIPRSPATKMTVKVGEVITKVNGIQVKTNQQFYEALQQNSAFCKLEIIDENGQVRFGQTALYDGEHHQVGIIFVRDGKKQLHDEVS